MNYTVTIIGSGKVANQLAVAFHVNEIQIVQIYGRRIGKARAIAELCNAEAVSNYDQISHSADVYVLTVSDDAIETVQASLPLPIRENKIVVHTSGFSSINKLHSVKHRGVFYPLNTFAEGSTVDFKQTPVFIDWVEKKDKEILHKLATRISDKVQDADDAQREQLHVAAVIVSNFSVALSDIAQKLMDDASLPMQYLKPLMERTYSNLLNHDAAEVITGPAVRGDEVVIEKHLRKLESYKEIRDIYIKLNQYITDNLKQNE